MQVLATGDRLWGRVRQIADERGVLSVLASCARWAIHWVYGLLRSAGPTTSAFVWQGERVPYVHRRYHYTWLNERAVEIALAQRLLSSCAERSVLEIGNVMGHYQPITHTVVDKYEVADGVLNVDVVDLDLEPAFDLVIAISTLEHVGLDEDIVDPSKPGRAIESLKSLLTPGGRLWVTIPVGYNPALDKRLRAGEYGFTSLRALRRSATRNVWREVPVDEIWSVPYDRLLYTAHGLVVAEYVRSDHVAADAPARTPRPPRA